MLYGCSSFRWSGNFSNPALVLSLEFFVAFCTEIYFIVGVQKKHQMAFLKRILFTLRMLHQNRHALAKIYKTSSRNRQLYQISSALLKLKGITVLVLDFDGVLAAHGEPYPVQELQTWLRECINTFGSTQVFVLSNKPLQSRITYFNHHYAGVQCIADVKKKPYPDGIQKIIALTGQPPSAVMLVDDRLLTGCLAACIVGIPVTYITHPYIRLSKRPVQELFFMTLRFLERHLIQTYARLE